MAKYKEKTKNCQLVIKVKLSYGEKLNEAEWDICSRNCIRGLLKAQILRKRVLEYTGPLGISLSERLKKPISRYDFFFIMEQIVDLIQKLRSNHLSFHSVIFDLHHVFINEITKEILFLYLPLENSKMKVDVRTFMESIIYNMIPEQNHNSNYISKFIYFLKGLETFNAEKMEQYIFQEESEAVNVIKKHNIGQSGFMTDKHKDYFAHYDNDYPETEIMKQNTDLGNVDNEETGLLAEKTKWKTEETGILQNDEVVNSKYIKFPVLYRVSTDEKIVVKKSVFRLGKEKSDVDFFVCNNNAVSRIHADIITRESRYFIMDLNSKNKTFINDRELQAKQEVEIYDGDRLRLANEEFVFYA